MEFIYSKPAVLCFILMLALSSCKNSDDEKPTVITDPPTSRFKINAALVTANTSFEANAVYQFLRNNYGNKILSGVMTLQSMDEVNWLKENTGKEPAIIGLDFMHTGRGYSWYDDKEPIRDAKNYWEKKGIPVFCWHWRDPSRKTENFYSKDPDPSRNTIFDISKINDPSSAEYTAMISDIDFVSGLLKELQDQIVPVIWRPLHEAAGGWFWWGAKGPAPCKKLYQIMFDRMANHHGLKNLIWVWTREPNDQAWYPGDEYVDIVGRDMYSQGNHSSRVEEFNAMNTLYGSKKMITLSECGSFPDPDNLTKDRAGWMWFMPWYGDFVRNSNHNPLDLWKKAFASNNVLTLDEMPSLKQSN
jgi:mannan endo-1,4-beta-mannosidase